MSNMWAGDTPDFNTSVVNVSWHLCWMKLHRSSARHTSQMLRLSRSWRSKTSTSRDVGQIYLSNIDDSGTYLVVGELIKWWPFLSNVDEAGRHWFVSDQLERRDGARTAVGECLTVIAEALMPSNTLWCVSGRNRWRCDVVSGRTLGLSANSSCEMCLCGEVARFAARCLWIS